MIVMDENKKDGSIFELGILIGRLAQLGADNGIVKKGKGNGITDIIETTIIVLDNTQFKEDAVALIKNDLTEIKQLLEKYQIDAKLTDEDSDKIIKLSSNWRRKISDELGKVVNTSEKSGL